MQTGAKYLLLLHRWDSERVKNVRITEREAIDGNLARTKWLRSQDAQIYYTFQLLIHCYLIACSPTVSQLDKTSTRCCYLLYNFSPWFPSMDTSILTAQKCLYVVTCAPSFSGKKTLTLYSQWSMIISFQFSYGLHLIVMLQCTLATSILKFLPSQSYCGCYAFRKSISPSSQVTYLSAISREPFSYLKEFISHVFILLTVLSVVNAERCL